MSGGTKISNNNSILRTENRKIRSLEYLLICLHSMDYLPGCTKISREKEVVKISILIRKSIGLKQKVLLS